MHDDAAVDFVQQVEGGRSVIEVPAILDPANRERARETLVGYFSTSDGVPNYTGSRFDDIGHIWSAGSHRNEFTAADIAALATLSVRVPGSGVIGVLSSRFQAEATALLEQIPVNASIGALDAYDTYLARGKPAWHLWNLVASVKGFGPVSTSKLLARKRANIVPIYDTETSAAWHLADVNHMWQPMHERLSANHGALLKYAQDLAREAGIPEHVAPLRVLDAIVWKHQKDSSG